MVGMRVALALGSGGARGYAHIGVIEELRERGHDIVGIAGSSMGALVGGIQAAGKLDEYTAWASSLTQGAVLRLLDPSITAAGVLRAGKILDAVREILGDVTIEELPIAFTSVATDLITGKSVWLQRGPVDDAIRASIAIPGVISPHVLDGRLLADGGILDPIPMAPIAAVNAHMTIAISLNGETPDSGPRETPGRPNVERWNRLWRNTSASLLDTKAARTLIETPSGRSMLSWFTNPADTLADDETAETPESALPKFGGFDMMNRTIDIAQAALARHTLAAYPPDLLIEVPRTVCRSLDFHRATEIIEIGRELAIMALDTLASTETPPSEP
jgi:NTE family protein